MKLDLHLLSFGIHAFCKNLDIVLQVQWIPRELNVEADALSREIDLDDWGVAQDFFNMIDQIWGPHSVDRFADNFNTKLSKFNSKYWCRGTSHVDAFSLSWEMENNWVVPPISLVVKAIKHIKASRAIATLVVPAWPSAFFWPLLFSNSSSFAKMVVHVLRFHDNSNIFVQGKNKKSIFGSKKFQSEVICVRLNGAL